MTRTHRQKLTLACLCLLPTLAPGAPGETVPARLGAPVALPSVACRYEIRLTDRGETPPRTVTSHWLFWRTERMIQTADGSGERGEIWELNGSGQIFYRKLYHGEKTAVEYLPSDSAVDQLHFDWARLSSLIDPASLERLNLEGAASFAGRPAERRSGWLHGHRTELLWLPVEGLPARLSKSDGRQTVEMNLLELKPYGEASIPPPALAEINRYRQIDHADFGDMESDPFVRGLIESEPHAH